MGSIGGVDLIERVDLGLEFVQGAVECLSVEPAEQGLGEAFVNYSPRAARVHAERRVPVLWAAAARIEAPSPVSLAARDGRPARQGFGISWDSWRIAIGDPYRARVAEFALWLSALDPDGVGQRAATMSRVDDLVARARVADVYLKIRIVGDVWLRDLRRGIEAARPTLGRTAEGARTLRALDNCESLVGSAKRVLEPFHIRTLVEDIF